MNNYILTKRQKIVTAAVIVTIGLLFTQNISIFYLKYRLIIGLSFISFLLSLWALWEGLTKVKAIVLMILPTMFTLAVASFYLLLPNRWLTRLPVALTFGLSFYFLLLSQNVFNVAAFRTIPLYRAASTVAFLFTLITAFFIYNVVFALDLSFYFNLIMVVLISFPLILQILWSLEMEKITGSILVYSGVLSLIIGECALALSFWPVVPTMWSLFLSSAMYVLLGITTEVFRNRLGWRIVMEYLGIGAVILIFTILTTAWTD